MIIYNYDYLLGELKSLRYRIKNNMEQLVKLQEFIKLDPVRERKLNIAISESADNIKRIDAEISFLETQKLSNHRGITISSLN